MASDCTVEREVQLQAQLFTFLKGAHEDLEPYWYKTVEGGDIDVSSLPLLLGITDETWRNFAVAAGIARVKQGGLQFKANVFVQLLHDYNIDATTTFMRRNEWRPNNQLMVQIGGSRRCKNDPPPPSLRSHLQNPSTKSPKFDHHPRVRRGRKCLMSNSTVKTAMETSSIAFGADKNEAGVESSTITTTEQVVTEMMGDLSIRTDRPELSIVTTQLTVVQTRTVITPMNDKPATNKDFLPGCSIMECSRRLPHSSTVMTTEAQPSSEHQLWTSSRLSALTTPLLSESSQQTSQSGSGLLARLVSPESQPRRTHAGNDNKTFGSRQVTVGVKEKYNVKNVPNTHTLITKSQEAKYKHCAEQIAKLNDYLSKEKQGKSTTPCCCNGSCSCTRSGEGISFHWSL
jgi:hypothetical protein